MASHHSEGQAQDFKTAGEILLRRSKHRSLDRGMERELHTLSAGGVFVALSTVPDGQS